MANEADITTEQRANLATLAAHLRTLPVDYPDFAMSLFVNDGDLGTGQRLAIVAECGTAACAAGHGPKAGVEVHPGETWMQYSCRAFVSEAGAWDWCFSANWAEADNTAHGAAARIEWLLEHGLPDDAAEQRWGEAPLCYLPAPVTSA